jgi:hypothetical protein
MIASALAVAPASAYGLAYSYTGTEQVYIVPAGATLVHVVAIGAPGGKGGFPQGSMGAVVSADVPVPQGQGVLYVEVGGTGDGFNGGGRSNGGYASDVRLVPSAQPGSIDSRIVVAGGGGGAGQFPGGNAGADGGGGASGGKAGTATAGGAGGLGQPPQQCADGSPGSLGVGGDGVADFYGPGAFGGGGGGYYGGGGGGGFGGCNFPSFYPTGLGGGGGGSSYVSPQASNTTFALDPSRTPQVTIAPPVTTPAPPPAVALSGLHVTPRKFAAAQRFVSGTCVSANQRNRTRPHCRRSVALHVTYTLNVASSVTFTIDLATPGRLVAGRCIAPTRATRRRKACTRLKAVAGGVRRQGAAGTNSAVIKAPNGARGLIPGIYELVATVAGGQGAGVRQAASFQIHP